MNPPSVPRLAWIVLVPAMLCASLPAAGRAAETPSAAGQTPPGFDGPPDFGGPPAFGGPPGFGPDGFGGPPDGFMPGGFGPGGMGGPGGPGRMNEERKLVKDYDRDGDGRLNNEERKAAREDIRQQGGNRGFGGPGGPGGRRGRFGGPGGGPGGPGGQSAEPASPGRRLTPDNVTAYPNAAIFDPDVLRTFFLEFENADWEQELADFKNSDVEVPATVTVDGKEYREVGVHFRGNTSFMFTGEGRKRPLNLSFDFVHKDQNLGGQRTLNLLNAHEDPSFLRALLYLEIARAYHPAPRANLIRVVINGECWGVYTCVQQFNKDFAQDWFGTTKGARWRVPGSPQTRAGLEYSGDAPAPYRRLYEIKTKDTPESWTELIKLCRTLNETDTAELPKAIEPILDVDGVLRFLAVEAVLINSDGYWVRSSDYNLYLDKTGRFHVLPHDINEALSGGGGPGGPGGGPGMMGGQRGRGFGGPGGPGGGGGGGGLELDPLVALQDNSKPLRSKLLQVPEYQARYLGYVRDIAEKWLDWGTLGPLAQKYHDLIAEDVKLDTRKAASYEAFERSLQSAPTAATTPAAEGRGGPGAGREKVSLKDFAERRRTYLLNHAAVKAATPPATTAAAKP